MLTLSKLYLFKLSLVKLFKAELRFCCIVFPLLEFVLIYIISFALIPLLNTHKEYESLVSIRWLIFYRVVCGTS